MCHNCLVCVRVHGKITTNMIKQIQKGTTIPNIVINNTNQQLLPYVKRSGSKQQQQQQQNKLRQKPRTGSDNAAAATAGPKYSWLNINQWLLRWRIIRTTTTTTTVLLKNGKNDNKRKNSSSRRTSTTFSFQCVQVTCTDGKNQQIRHVFAGLGWKWEKHNTLAIYFVLNILYYCVCVCFLMSITFYVFMYILIVTRLIQISYGDYNLNTIAPGAVIGVPCKSIESQRNKGSLFMLLSSSSSSSKEQVPKRRSHCHHHQQWLIIAITL